MGRSRRKRRASQALVEGKTPKNPVVIDARTPDSVPARLFGLGLAGTGAAHFTAPQLFDTITGVAFPRHTRQWTYRNGGTELLLGLAITFRRTRVLGAVGLLAYVGFLGSRFAGGKPGERS
ncbi:hypothetical protein [Nocardia sp. BMG51109]|uniref:hypothetical protein n=1 Tax=Nocardia sp. BMG51109 TaxID=1056816 RepID=UPI000465C17E|nr:hypothetical protein [Nocardia sp. BMG51109]